MVNKPLVRPYFLGGGALGGGGGVARIPLIFNSQLGTQQKSDQLYRIRKGSSPHAAWISWLW